MMFFASSDAKANDTIQLSVPPCAYNVDGCTGWTNWAYFTRPMQYQSNAYWPNKFFNCNTLVTYRIRQCISNPNMHQIDIVSIELDLSYRVWYLFAGGWVYPCREALDILKGSAAEVSGLFNSLYNAIYEDIVEADYTMRFKIAEELDEIYAGDLAHFKHNPCKQPDPGNPWNVDLLTVVSVNASCQANCVTWSNNDSPVWYRDSVGGPVIGPIEVGMPLQFLADKYSGGSLDNLIVEPLDSAGLSDLNDYIQTEINPYILEEEHQVPILFGLPRMKITKLPCTEDFCCVYTMNVCQDEDGNAFLYNKMITGMVPDECVNNTTIPIAFCPPSYLPPIPYPCNSNCTPTIFQSPDVSIDEENTTIINIYPNPTSKLINFDVPIDQVLNNLELFDINGNLLCKFNTDITTLDLSAYNTGEYYLCFTLNNTKYYRSIILSK
jgi:hypothetical protein